LELAHWWKEEMAGPMAKIAKIDIYRGGGIPHLILALLSICQQKEEGHKDKWAHHAVS
jgi:hypothetical protein